MKGISLVSESVSGASQGRTPLTTLQSLQFPSPTSGALIPAICGNPAALQGLGPLAFQGRRGMSRNSNLQPWNVRVADWILTSWRHRSFQGLRVECVWVLES